MQNGDEIVLVDDGICELEISSIDHLAPAVIEMPSPSSSTSYIGERINLLRSLQCTLANSSIHICTCTCNCIGQQLPAAELDNNPDSNDGVIVQGVSRATRSRSENESEAASTKRKGDLSHLYLCVLCSYFCFFAQLLHRMTR